MTTTVTELAQDIGLARETDYYFMAVPKSSAS